MSLYNGDGMLHWKSRTCKYT